VDHKGPQIVMARVHILYSMLLIHYSSVTSILRGRYSVILLDASYEQFFVKVQSSFWHYLGLILFHFKMLVFSLYLFFLQAIVLETISVYFLLMLILYL